jgi:tripartite-type tricarboxylate transporter receptor subunit TctC
MLKNSSRWFTAAVAVAVGMCGSTAVSVACPSSMKIVVAYPPGSPDDMVGRLIAQKMNEAGQTAVIENLPGAAGKIGNAAAAKAPVDGCTLLIASSSVSVHAAAGSKTPYDIQTSFMPVAMLTKAPETISVHPSVPAKTMQEFAALVKANPGKYSYATPGFASSPHLAGERLFRVTLGLDVANVPYQGGPPAVNATIGGHTQIVHLTLPVVAAAVKDGKLRMLAVADTERHSMFPNVPTLAESGVAGHELGFWNAMLVPQGTPPALVEALHARITAIMNSDDVRQRLQSLGFTTVTGTRADVTKHISDDIARLKSIIAATGVKID